MSVLFVTSGFYLGYSISFQVFFFLYIFLFLFKSINPSVLLLILFLLSLSCIASIVYLPDSTTVFLRDFLYFSLIPLVALSEKPHVERIYAAAILVARFHSIVIILLSVGGSSIFLMSPEIFSSFRGYFLLSGYGDVYTHGSGYVRVQILGNSMLFVMAILNVYDYFCKKRKFSILFGFGVIVSGSLAFIASYTLLFVALLMRRIVLERKVKLLRFLASLLVIIASAVIMFNYSYYSMQLKIGGEQSSMGHRAILFSDFLHVFDARMVFLGNGLGAMMHLTSLGTVVNYIELQFLLLIVKFGLVIFLLWNILLFWLLRGGWRFLIYTTYLVGCSMNPYIFDATHLLAVLFISSVVQARSHV